MMSRSLLLSAACFAVACGRMPNNMDAGCVGLSCPEVGGGTGTTGGGSGSTGGGSGSTGGGTGATGGGTGSTGGSGGSTISWDGGRTVDAVKGARYCEERVTLENVVVVGVERANRGNLGDYDTSFWVVDLADSKKGIYVDKFYTDLPGPYLPKLGDVLKLEGFVKRRSDRTDRTANRVMFGSTFGCSSRTDAGVGVSTKLQITVVDAGAVVPFNTAPAGFGNANNGNARPNPEYAGTRVFIPGPLQLINAAPTAFTRISTLTNDTTNYGFELDGGILVNNYMTYDFTQADGGGRMGCDWRKYALDAGAQGQIVIFPNGVYGVWDTYSHAPCYDGGTGCSDGFSNRDAGVVPGTNNFYTYVLWPNDCSDLVGEVR